MLNNTTKSIAILPVIILELKSWTHFYPLRNSNEPGEITQEHTEQVINDAKNSVKIQKVWNVVVFAWYSASFIIDNQDDIHNL